MHILSILPNGVSAVDSLAEASMPAEPGFLWIICTNAEFGNRQQEIQTALHSLCGMQLVDLHISDLLNPYIPSHYDYTYQYDILVFRRLAASNVSKEKPPLPEADARRKARTPILRKIDTSPVGFALFDRVLLSVHPADCPVREVFTTRLLAPVSAEGRVAGARLPTSTADLMLRLVNLMVDGFLELRRELTHQLDYWQAELLDPQSRFDNWASLLDARLTLHYLDEICEDQLSAIQDWIEALTNWPEPETQHLRREYDLLQVSSRDVLEHLERVAHHVRRLEQSTETTVQIHFNIQGHRTNDIMRTLTVLTAIFLPLNLIAGIFGMNFESLPLIHTSSGFWLAIASMLFIATALGVFFWKRRYLDRGG